MLVFAAACVEKRGVKASMRAFNRASSSSFPGLFSVGPTGKICSTRSLGCLPKARKNGVSFVDFWREVRYMPTIWDLSVYPSCLAVHLQIWKGHLIESDYTFQSYHLPVGDKRLLLCDQFLNSYKADH